MRVISSLADIEFGIGRISRRGSNLVLESNASSTLETVVTVTPGDALASLGAIIASPSAWVFMLKLPFAIFANGRRDISATDAWAARRSMTGLNKPW